MYLVNNAGLIWLPFFSRGFPFTRRIFPARIFRLPRFHPLPSLLPPAFRIRAPWSEGNPKNSVERPGPTRDHVKSHFRLACNGDAEDRACTRAYIRVYVRACNAYSRAIAFPDSRRIAHFGTFLSNLAKNRERKGIAGEGRGKWSLLGTEMEPCVRDDYTRERNKKRNKDGDLWKKGKDRRDFVVYVLRG